jgi:hypothetical protein
MRDQQISDELAAKLGDDILDILNLWSSNTAQIDYKDGASVSHLIDLLRGKGWKFSGGRDRIEMLIEDAGFDIMSATTKTGFHKSARVVVI